MIGQKEILRALRVLLEAQGHTVYTGEVPQDFVRPSVLVLPAGQTRRDSTFGTVRVSSRFTLCGYVPLDAYRRADPEAGSDMQDALLGAFLPGALPVGDRSLRAAASTGGADEACVYVDVTLEYDDDRARPMPGADAVGQINLRVEGKRYGIAED